MLRFCLAVALALSVARLACGANLALLVGVSEYPNLPKEKRLHGPTNDVPLIRSLLLKRNFRAEDIRVLADGVRPAHGQPTRAAILRGLDELAKKAGKGDFVFLFFAGHGSQQPAQDLEAEPDGLDEIFLPRDIGKWVPAQNGFQNAIVDDTLGEAITAIRNTGAFVWAVFDTCHSGTITRALPARDRQVKPEEIDISAAVKLALQQVRQGRLPVQAADPARLAPSPAKKVLKDDAGGYVGFFAAQSNETTPEDLMPLHASATDRNKKPYGVFTYTLAEALESNPAISYRQLAEEVLRRYWETGRRYPTPMWEGTIDAPVFGTRSGEQLLQWKLEKTDSGWRVPAGQLHRVSAGAIFGLFEKPTDRDEQVIGHVRATEVNLLSSVVIPAGKPLIPEERLTPHLYARLVNANMALSLGVAFPPTASTADEKAALQLLQSLAGKPVAGLAPDWRPATQSAEVRLFLGEGQLWFLPPDGEIVRQGRAKTPSIELAGKSAEQISTLTVETLRGIAKATNLLKLGSMAGTSELSREVETAPVYERNGKPLDASSSVHLLALRDGDKVNVRIDNRSKKTIDVNFLFIDSRYAISHLRIERLRPFEGAPYSIGTVRTAKTIGRESVLMIVTEGVEGAAPQDFRFLAQPGLQAMRSGPQSNLSELLERAGFRPERMRELESPSRTAREAVFRVFAWDTISND